MNPAELGPAGDPNPVRAHNPRRSSSIRLAPDQTAQCLITLKIGGLSLLGEGEMIRSRARSEMEYRSGTRPALSKAALIQLALPTTRFAAYSVGMGKKSNQARFPVVSLLPRAHLRNIQN